MGFPLRTYNEGRTIGLDYSFTNTGTPPVTVNDVKLWSKIDFGVDDNIIDDLIDETIDNIERHYNFTIIDKTVTATWESYGRNVSLPLGPVKSITSVKRIDHEGTETTLTENDDYRHVGDELIFQEVYQYERPFYRMHLEVVYDTGWSSFPSGITLGLKKAFDSDYHDRQDLVGGMSVSELPNGSKSKFENYRNY